MKELRSRVALAVLMAAAALILFVKEPSAATEIAGTFALQGGTHAAQAHLLASPQDSPLHVKLDYWLTRKGGTRVVRDYTTEMTKKLHLIVIGADFTTFLHVHPVLAGNGHFSIVVVLPHAGRYYLYADDQPAGLPKQVFRFQLDAGAVAPVEQNLHSTGKVVAAGPYVVSLNSTTLNAGDLTMLTVHIRKHGKPAGDLQAYLGAPAHAVFINATTLDYVHVHPMALSSMGGDDTGGMGNMGGMNMGDMNGGAMHMTDVHGAVSPDMMLHVVVPRSGVYKLWLQFLGGGHLYVAPFVLEAQ
jgi:hypothetical protein